MEFSEQYLKYEDYRALGGTLAETPFNLLEFECRRKIDRRTQNRLKEADEIPKEVKLCIFQLVEKVAFYAAQIKNAKNGIVNESIDGYSIAYLSGSQVQDVLNSKKKEMDDIIMDYLYGVIVNGEHVLFLGVA